MESAQKRAQIQSVALFFFFAFLDERVALRATFRALDELGKSKISDDQTEKNGSSRSAHLIAIMHKNWKHHQKTKAHLVTENIVASGWDVPAHLDLGPWKQFLKQAVPNDVLVVIWSQILNFQTPEIAAGLGISPGTVQYRLSNGLKLLGTMTPLGALKNA